MAGESYSYLGVGSNLGDRQSNIRRAVELLDNTRGIQNVRLSPLLENPAVGGPVDSPAFLNGAIEIRTTLSPQQLLDRLLEIEQTLGRVRRERWEPRPIDLDILFFADQVLHTPTLTIPHPRLHERVFVLQPLADLAPDFLHPGLQKTVGQLLHALRSASRLT